MTRSGGNLGTSELWLEVLDEFNAGAGHRAVEDVLSSRNGITRVWRLERVVGLGNGDGTCSG